MEILSMCIRLWIAGVAGDWYLWFPWQPPSDWKEPEYREESCWEGLCDSPMSRQETVKSSHPVLLWRHRVFFLSFYQPTKILGGSIDNRKIAWNGWLLRSPWVRKKVVLFPLKASKSSKSSSSAAQEWRNQAKVSPRVSTHMHKLSGEFWAEA